MKLTTDLKISIWKMANLANECKNNEIGTAEFENAMLEELKLVKNLNLAGINKQSELLELLTEIANSTTIYSNTRHKLKAKELLKLL
jgi:hypothetical protein